jgi:hypothetical protein
VRQARSGISSGIQEEEHKVKKLTADQIAEVRKAQEVVSGLVVAVRGLYDANERITDNKEALNRLDLSNAATALDKAAQALARVTSR